MPSIIDCCQRKFFKISSQGVEKPEEVEAFHEGLYGLAEILVSSLCDPEVLGEEGVFVKILPSDMQYLAELGGDKALSAIVQIANNRLQDGQTIKDVKDVRCEIGILFSWTQETDNNK